MINKNMLCIAAVATAAVAGCGVATNHPGETPKDSTAYLDRANMDTTVKPGDNFFLYANGAWLKKTPIPGDKTGWGSFYELADNTNKSVHTLLEDVARENAATGTPQYNVASFYKSGMDTVAIDKAGTNAIKSELDAIKAITTPQQLLDVVIENGKKGLQTILPNYVGPDDRHVTQNIVQFSQGGLGLPSKDYYTDKDSSAEKTGKLTKPTLPKF